MNHLTISLEKSNKVIQPGILCLFVNLTIDGVSPLAERDHQFNICELIRSMRANGTYWLWTCSCGVEECAGYTHGVSVEINDSVITWNDLDQNKSYKFETDELRKTIEKLKLEVLKWNEQAKSYNFTLAITPIWEMEYLLSVIRESTND